MNIFYPFEWSNLLNFMLCLIYEPLYKYTIFNMVIHFLIACIMMNRSNFTNQSTCQSLQNFSASRMNLSSTASILLDEAFRRAYEDLGKPKPKAFVDLMKKKAQTWVERDRFSMENRIERMENRIGRMEKRIERVENSLENLNATISKFIFEVRGEVNKLKENVQHLNQIVGHSNQQPKNNIQAIKMEQRSNIMKQRREHGSSNRFSQRASESQEGSLGQLKQNSNSRVNINFESSPQSIHPILKGQSPKNIFKVGQGKRKNTVEKQLAERSQEQQHSLVDESQNCPQL